MDDTPTQEATRQEAASVEWAVASRPAAGEVDCGDVATVNVGPQRCVFAVIDGLGHGAEAARAAALAAKIVDQSHAEAPEVVLALVHEGLADSRGAAATLAVIDATSGRMDWLGVGNVDGLLVRAADGALGHTRGVFLRGGVLGDRMPPLHRPEPVRLENGDCIVLATDGVRGDLAAAARSDLRVDLLAQRILDDHAITDDDALVLVARYRPPDPPSAGAT